MPIGTGLANLGNMIKAATSGLVQSVTGGKNTKESEKSNTSTATGFVNDAEEHSESSTATAVKGNDQVALSDEAQDQSAKTEYNNQQTAKQDVQQNFQQNTQLQAQPRVTEQKGQVQGSFVNQKEASEVERAQQTEAPNPQQEVENSQQPGNPQASGAPGKPAAELQSLLQGWLQLDPKTITGLERFLQVEFTHYPEDYQLFMNMRMMNMLKDARRLIEEQKLASMGNDASQETDTPEGAKRAMIGAALMGYAYYKVLRKRAKLKDQMSAGENGILRGPDGEPLTPFGSLQEAERFLKEAEKELQRAMYQGMDNDRIRALAGKVMDICAQIGEMQVDGGSPGASLLQSNKRAKQSIA